MPLCLGAPGSVRARHMAQSASRASEVHTFWPLSFQPPSTFSAVVRSAARSEPAPGSENSWHHLTVPAMVSRTSLSACSGAAWRMVGTAQPPMVMSWRATPAASSSSSIISCSAGEAPRPHGSGRCGMNRPVSARARLRSSPSTAATRATSARISSRLASIPSITDRSMSRWRRLPASVSSARERRQRAAPPIACLSAPARRR